MGAFLWYFRPIIRLMSKKMAETTMPAAEVSTAITEDVHSYELAFHVLPTVAEGEVPSVFEALKALITKAGGELFDEEAPERFDLAYEIEKHMEGKNRKFTSAYFGWVRFKVSPEAIASLIEEVEGDVNILRHLLLKLTKVEEANPFRFHEALASQKMVTTVEEPKVVEPETEEAKKKEVAAEEDNAEEVSAKDDKVAE